MRTAWVARRPKLGQVSRKPRVRRLNGCTGLNRWAEPRQSTRSWLASESRSRLVQLGRRSTGCTSRWGGLGWTARWSRLIRTISRGWLCQSSRRSRVNQLGSWDGPGWAGRWSRLVSPGWLLTSWMERRRRPGAISWWAEEMILC